MKKRKDITMIDNFFNKYDIEKTDTNIVLYKNLIKSDNILNILILRQKEVLGLVNFFHQNNYNIKEAQVIADGNDVEIQIENESFPFFDITKKEMESLISMISIEENKEGR